MTNTKPLQPLRKDMLQVGAPLKHPVFDANGVLLLRAGMVIESRGQLEKLFSQGLFLDSLAFHDLQSNSDKRSKKNSEEKNREAGPQTIDALAQQITVNLQIGDAIQLKPLSENSSDAYFVKYLGGMDKRSIICTLPIVDDKVVFIKESAGFSVNLFSGRNVYTFTSVAEAVFSRPYPHMHLKYPRQVTMTQVRRSPRVKASIITSIANLSAEAKASGRIVDMSMGGALLESPASIAEIGDTVECTFKVGIGGSEAYFVIKGIIRSRRETMGKSGEAAFQFGIEFGEIAFQEKILLQNYILLSISNTSLEDL